MLKKIVLIFGLLMALLVTAGGVYVFTSGPEITEDMEHTIRAAIKAELPELTHETGFAVNGETNIWYEVIRPDSTPKGTVLLIMGLSADALAWPDYFIEGLTEAGYQVIRFDNRGVGLTDWDDFDPENPYSLSNMSDDCLAILDTLKVEKAHIAGVSLGGMIGQTLCIEHPERALSLTSIMSTPWIMDPDLPTINMECIRELVLNMMKYGTMESEENSIKLGLATRMILMGSEKYDLDVERISQLTLYNLRKRNGYNRQSGQQQTAAVEESGSRIEALQTLTTPTLVVHGKTDPLIPFVHGQKTAELIPNAKTLWIEGLGHTVPEMYSNTIISHMVQLMDSANNTTDKEGTTLFTEE